MLFKDTFSFPQLQTSNFCQDQEYKLKIDNKTLNLSFLYDFKLYKVKKLDQIKLYRKLFGFFSQKNLFVKNKRLNNLCNKIFYTLNILITNLTNV